MNKYFYKLISYKLISYNIILYVRKNLNDKYNKIKINTGKQQYNTLLERENLKMLQLV